jgi:ParB family chromosome partitioning protein
MKQRGYRESEIAQKTGLTVEYVRNVIRLLETGEERLLRAVEAGTIPVSVAVEIAMADDAGVQRILQQAYEKKLLRGSKLVAVKRLIEQRRRRGKGMCTTSHQRELPLSVTTLLRTYRDNTDKKRMIVRKAEMTRDRLVFITAGLNKVFQDENFVTLLRAEGLDTLPSNLRDRLATGGHA